MRLATSLKVLLEIHAFDFKTVNIWSDIKLYIPQDLGWIQNKSRSDLQLFFGSLTFLHLQRCVSERMNRDLQKKTLQIFKQHCKSLNAADAI